MEMPKPTEKHARLSRLAGTWTGEEKLFPAPWAPQGGLGRGRLVARVDFDGFFLVSDYTQERDGKVTYRGHGLYGWDSHEKCYTMHWFSTAGGGGYTMPGRGVWEGDRLIFHHDSPMGRSRYIYELRSESEYFFRIETSKDGREWASFMEAVYRRE